MNVLFCNIGWMKFYNGISNGDTIKAGMSWIKEHKTGGEIFNFTNDNGICYGFVMTQGSININNFGAKKNDNYVDDVFVIWLSSHPRYGQVRIVGWYNNARVYRIFQEPEEGTTRGKLDYWYNIVAKADDVVLLPVDERTHIIPKATKSTGGIGQSTTWYCAGEKNSEILKSAIEYIDKYKSRKMEKKKIKNANVEVKQEVEKRAVDYARCYYENYGYNVESVEKDNVGWDLEAIMGEQLLRIEVKGLSGGKVQLGLTPNEYKSMKAYKDSYRVFVLINALNEKEQKHFIFSYENGRDVWTDDRGKEVVIEEKTAAILRL